MNQTQTLKRDLINILLMYPSTLWPSESDEPIQVVERGWWQLFGQTREKDGTEQMYLESAKEAAQQGILDMEPVIAEAPDALQKRHAELIQNGYRGLNAICNLLLQQDRLICIKRKSKKPGEYTLFILAYFGWSYVGIKTRITES